ncbi:phosphoglycerate mutase-like protein [Dentipellis sp. KUC8613]|nr:phosphoglycerate mutase-like protein [Dentipellis sp. KUC8613]
MAPVAVYIVRHGETEENRLGVVQGQLDTALNATGRAQAARVAEALRDVPFDAAYASDLARAAVTAEIILKHHPGVPLRKVAELRERYMGERQGRRLPAPPDPPEISTVESADALAARARAWWEGCVVREHATRGAGQAEGETRTRAVLVVSHGGFIGMQLRTLVAAGRVRCVGGVRSHGRLPNTSVTIVEVDEDGAGALMQFGDVSHMEAGGEGAVGENADVQEKDVGARF